MENSHFLIKALVFQALFFSSLAFAQDEKKSDHDSSYKIVPVISSNPTAGTGAGVMGTLMYKADKDSSPSQAILSAQYTNTDSYNIVAINKLFFDSDKWQSNTVYAHVFNNTSFSIDGSDFGFDTYFEPNLHVTVDGALQQFLYLVHKNIYFGGHAFYMKQVFEADNAEGEFFLKSNGITDSSRGGIGALLSYDTRTKKEKFYPTDSTFVNLSFNYFPEFLGSDKVFYNGLINARKYLPLGKSNDILALQYLGQFCSENTPDGALSALGARNVLRGFPIGKYKTRYMNAFQAEYRYTIGQTRFRLAPFAGYANLSGGSKGTATGNRDSDNGNYYSGGAGVHYILEKKHQLDYRIDLVYSSDEEVSVYASMNQAF